MDGALRQGPSGLFERERKGRPRKIDDGVEEEIERLLQTDPTEEGENATRWTTPRIAKHLEEELDIDVHPETVRESLKRLEYSWTRPCRQLREGPDYEERMALLVGTVATVDPDTTVLFAGETRVKRFPPLDVCGNRSENSGPSGCRRLTTTLPSTALDICTGETYIRAFERKCSEHTIDFLEVLKTQTIGKVLVIWDQATWHTSQQVETFLDDVDRFETFLLPKRAPEANPMEDLWRELKEQMAVCLERSLGALLTSCRQHFEALSPKQALRIASIGYE